MGLSLESIFHREPEKRPTRAIKPELVVAMQAGSNHEIHQQRLAGTVAGEVQKITGEVVDLKTVVPIIHQKPLPDDSESLRDRLVDEWQGLQGKTRTVASESPLRLLKRRMGSRLGPGQELEEAA